MCSTAAATAKLELSSPDLKEGQRLKDTHAWKTGNKPPHLAWKNFPAGTKSFALIADDPDAPKKTWVHWVVYNIPATEHALGPLGKSASLPNGLKQGINDFNEIGYDGPYPPAGENHHYYFKLYALDMLLSLPEKATKAQLEAAMKGHILGKASLIGTYSRNGVSKKSA